MTIEKITATLESAAITITELLVALEAAEVRADALAADIGFMTENRDLFREAAQVERARAEAAELREAVLLVNNEAERQTLIRHNAAHAAKVADLTAKLEAMTERMGFPILHGQGASVDWQLVADHAQQANRNHGQSVARLAERGGLSWCELFAVLHNKRWQKMDANEAMIACRALEARYLAALKTGGAA